MRRSRMYAVVTALMMFGTLLASGGPAAASHVEHTAVPSKAADGLPIHISIFKPDGASELDKAPVILHSHGWAGSRSSSEDAFSNWLDEGFAVVSIDQRGHGDTGDIAHTQDPDLEGQDIIAVIDHIATLPWIAKDVDGSGEEITDDPVMGAIGGSYGGGYQLITALTEIRDRGHTRFNALAPQITWNNLSQSLGPQDVPRTLWNALLYGVGATFLPQHVHESFLLGNATGTFPNGEIPGTYDLKDRFYRNSPAWFADNEMFLDIPVLFGQGTSDNLFPLNEAYHNFEEVLTPEARAQSLLVGYNGGHVLPAVVPAGGETSSGDACSGGFTELTMDFFSTAFAGGDTAALLPTQYGITTVGGTCLQVDSFDADTELPVGDGVVVSPAGLGAPVAYPIAEGPITVAGIPVLRGKATSLGVDARAYFALSVGTSPLDAEILQGNTMPLRQRFPVVDEPTSLELAGVAVEVPAGQTLYLTVSAVADMFVGTNRYPGTIVLTDAVVDLPVH